MPYFAKANLPETCAPYRILHEAIVLRPGTLSRLRKESIHRAVAAAPSSDSLAGLTVQESALVGFSEALSLAPTSIGTRDFDRLRALGFSDEELLEAILATSLARCHRVLVDGLGAGPDLPAAARSDSLSPQAPSPASAEDRKGPYLRSIERKLEEFEPFAYFRAQLGFVPKLFQAQGIKAEPIEAEAKVFRELVLAEGHLSVQQKAQILLAVSAADRNTYWVALLSRVLRTRGVSDADADAIALTHRDAAIPEADKALLDAGRRLVGLPVRFGQADIDTLRSHGFSDDQILEAVLTAAFAAFLDTLQMGLGALPDFRPRHDFLAQPAPGVNPDADSSHPMGSERTADPDAPLVALAQAGDMSAFEALVRRHQGLVYRTVLGLTGNAEDAEDGAQSVFIKVFRKIGDFGGASRFSTWLTRIAINEGLERLRSRKPMESLEESVSEDEFRPSRIEAWVDDPESLYARDETRRLVQQELSRLPVVYRMAVMLRDIQQLSTAEAAAALAVPVPTLKTRLLRGRLMLREALSAHFAGSGVRARLA